MTCDYDIDLLTNVVNYNHEKFLSFKNNLPFETNDTFDHILNARYHKASRIKKRFVYLLVRYNYVWFCTFTFDNHYINKSTRTKRDLIKSVINTHDFVYILNIDYGKTTNREHYHCIIGSNINFDVNQFLQDNYPCFCLAIPVRRGFSDFQRLSKYINKLVNHCLKPTTNRQRILYNFKGYDDFCPTSKDIHFAYILELEFLKNVPLLDKGDITGNFT